MLTIQVGGDILNREFIDVLKNGVKPALGCTEPVAVGLAVAKAYEAETGEVKGVTVRLSPNIIKNGMGVGIPGTTKKGLEFASALALACGRSEYGLQVFKDVNDEAVEKAEKYLREIPIKIKLEDKKNKFYIEALVETDKGVGSCTIVDSHTNIIKVNRDDVVLFERDKDDTVSSAKKFNFDDTTIKDLREFVETVNFEDIKFLLDGVKMNFEIAKAGLKEKSGAGLGAAMVELSGKNLDELDLVSRARIMTAAASDARMSGMNMPVMSSAGSGNHGLTAIIPTAVVCEELGCDDEKLARGLALSHLTTAFVKHFTGSLSPVCGCSVAAGVGASASVAWLLGGTDEQIGGAIKNMIGTIAGMICDGAKEGCAFKLSTSASEAIIQAQLATKNIIIEESDGIVGKTVEDSIRNLGALSNEGLKDADAEILRIMMNK